MRLVLVRHGESVCAVEGVVGGPKGCTGLTERGKAQAAALRDRFERTGEIVPDVVYASTLPRAVQTAEIVAGAFGGADVIQDDDLVELVPGECDGMTWDAWREARGGPLSMLDQPDEPLSPGGESLNAFASRVERLLQRLARDHAGQTVLAACHGGIVFTSMSVLFGMHERRRRTRMRADYTSITEWELGGGAPWEGAGDEAVWRLVRLNDVAHLRGSELLLDEDSRPSR